MGVFKYIVINKEGKRERGFIDAPGVRQVQKILEDKGLVIVDISQKNTVEIFTFFNRIKTNEIVFMVRQLSILFSSSVSATKSFEIISDYAKNPQTKKMLDDISSELISGKNLSEAFKKYEDVFGEFFVGLVSVGEESGDLPNTFNYLADYFEERQKTRNDIIKALTYPAIVVLLLISVVLFLFTNIIPQLKTVLESFNAELPLITQIVLSISDFVSLYFYAIISVLIFTLIAFIQYISTKKGKEVFDTSLLEVPVLSNTFHTFYHIRFSDALAILLKGGVPLLKALEIVQNTMTNTVYRKALEQIIGRVRSGLLLSQAMEEQKVFDKTLYSMISVGEQSGSIGDILINISRIYKQRFDVAINLVTSLIQPLSIMILGGVVGGTIAAVMLPIYSLAGSIGG